MKPCIKMLIQSTGLDKMGRGFGRAGKGGNKEWLV